MSDGLEIVALTPEERASWIPAYRALEAERWYPLGTDRFRIDHGEDPFRFVDGLGSSQSFAAVLRGELVGWLTVVHRVGVDGTPLAYVCDFKTSANAPPMAAWGLLRAGFAARSASGPGYAVLMDGADGPGRLARTLLSRGARAGIELGPTLVIYGTDAEGWNALCPMIEARRGPTQLRNLVGVKDIVLESSGRPMALLHAQWGRWAQGPAIAPQRGAVHMFCAACGDDLDQVARTTSAVTEMGRARVLHRGLRARAVALAASLLTSDI